MFFVDSIFLIYAFDPLTGIVSPDVVLLDAFPPSSWFASLAHWPLFLPRQINLLGLRGTMAHGLF